ncbi:MAG: branched-chain amino acid ABC transporter permease [Anaerolineae bacterium]|nr:branched-chain amino acid ABC transporter permease [Anaerolineae bacterium]
MPTVLLIDSLVRSLQAGSMYALMALGLTLTLAVIRLPNFAHSELITLGGYIALVTSLWLTNSLPLMLALAFIASAVAAVACHRTVYRPLSKINTSTYTMILASFAVGLILRYIIFLLADRFDLFDKKIQAPLQVWYRGHNLILTNLFFWAVPTAILLMVALSLILNYTTLGRQMRALADNFTLARVLGIPVERVHDLTWLLVGGLAGVAGALWGLYTSLNPLLGWLAILSVFAATVLGGMTSFSGTVLGAYVVALAENTLMQLLNSWFGLDFSFKPAIPFVIIIMVLLLRPQGFTGLSLNLGGPKHIKESSRELGRAPSSQ